jgi:S1-C subfamily serine protease
VTPSLVRLRKLDIRQGAYVAVVTPGEGAGRAGVRRGDVMIEVDGKRVASNDDVVRIVREHRPGDTLRVVVRRGGTTKDLNVTLGELPNA